MASALVGVCVDPRINHELIRIQVRQRLERSGIRAERIYVLNEVGETQARTSATPSGSSPGLVNRSCSARCCTMMTAFQLSPGFAPTLPCQLS